MDINAIKNKIKKSKTDYVEIEGYSFELTTINDFDLTRFAMKSRKDENYVIEIELILSSITNYKGIKLKDIVSGCEDDEEANEEVPYDRDLLSEFLGKNQSIMITLYEKIGERMEAYKTKTETQKKT